MSDLTRPTRPVYRNIHISQIVSYRLPPGGIVSILHRVSGAILFLLLPFVLYLFDKSLTSEISFTTFKSITSNGFAKLALLVLLWSYLHHFVAGVRHLFMDVHIGVEKDSGRKTAISVLVISLVLWVALGLKLLGAF